MKSNRKFQAVFRSGAIALKESTKSYQYAMKLPDGTIMWCRNLFDLSTYSVPGVEVTTARSVV